MIINKADLISEEIRMIWSNFLKEKSINHIFFSAKEEQIKIDEDLENKTQVIFYNFRIK